LDIIKITFKVVATCM